MFCGSREIGKIKSVTPPRKIGFTLLEFKKLEMNQARMQVWIQESSKIWKDIKMKSFHAINSLGDT